MRGKKGRGFSDKLRMRSEHRPNALRTLLFAIALAGCSGGNAPEELPRQESFPVSYVLDLMGEGYRLREPFTMMTVTEPRRPGDRLGAGGLLVTHTHTIGGEGEAYAAFDLACPYEWPSIVPIRIREEGLMEAVCPKCGTVYDFSLGAGLPKEGKSPYPLWQYSAVLRGTVLEITNGPHIVK